MKATVQTKEMRYVSSLCYHCNQAGHFRRNCPVLTAERKQNLTRPTVARNNQEDPGCSGSGRGVCFTTTTGGSVSIGSRWIIDTGCTKHMTGSPVTFEGMKFCNEKVSLADGRTVTARGSGQARITGAGLGGEAVNMELKELLYVPGLSGSVLSVSRITSNGYEVLFRTKDCKIQKGGKVVAVGDRIGGLYYLRQPVVG